MRSWRWQADGERGVLDPEATVSGCELGVPLLIKPFAGLATGRWYAQYADCLTVAVTEKRTKTEIDGLTGMIQSRLSVITSGSKLLKS